jgi:hypothetical protein
MRRKCQELFAAPPWQDSEPPNRSRAPTNPRNSTLVMIPLTVRTGIGAIWNLDLPVNLRSRTQDDLYSIHANWQSFRYHATRA